MKNFFFFSGLLASAASLFSFINAEVPLYVTLIFAFFALTLMGIDKIINLLYKLQVLEPKPEQAKEN